MPFVVSIIIAYLLNPSVNYLDKKLSLPRLFSSLLIVVFFAAVFVSICMVLFPVIYNQFIGLTSVFPAYLEKFTNEIYPQILIKVSEIGFEVNYDIKSLLSNDNVTTGFFNVSKGLFQNAFSSTIVVINILSLIFISPILIFYLLKDWDKMINCINSFLPIAYAKSIRSIAKEIDDTLAKYLRGQFNVCLILGIIYASLLSYSGLNFGFLIGFLTGFLSFIPYVAMLIGITIAIIVALFQWGFDLVNLGIVSAIFIFGQMVEANFLTPKLIGDKIGVHPIWVIFGLFFFGLVLGAVGLIMAVPLTAIFGVVIRNLAITYQKKAC